jgi:hypothetical protein
LNEPPVSRRQFRAISDAHSNKEVLNESGIQIHLVVVVPVFFDDLPVRRIKENSITGRIYVKASFH